MYPREEDYVFMNLPPTEKEAEKGWKKLAPNGQKNGRTIYCFQCLHCHKVFGNHKNAGQHLKICPVIHPKDPTQSTITMYLQRSPDCHEKSKNNKLDAICELIARANIPRTQIQAPFWKKFIHHLDPDFVIPSDDVIVAGIHDLAKRLIDSGLQDLKNRYVGLCIDGGGFFLAKFYAFIFVTHDKVRHARFVNVKKQDAATLADLIAEIIREADIKGIHISAICSDNARNLIAACKSNEGTLLRARIGRFILRVSCASHTSQLSLNDVTQNNALFQKILDDIISLLQYIMKRDKQFSQYVPKKVPYFIKTRWNSACDVLEFFIQNDEKTNSFLKDAIIAEERAFNIRNEKNQRRTEQHLPPLEPYHMSLPCVNEIPNEWYEVLDPLLIIRQFTQRIEGDVKMQMDVFLSARNATQQLNSLHDSGNQFAKSFLDAFEMRFSSTADLLLAEIAYRFTPEGVHEFRNTVGIALNSPDDEERLKAGNHYENLKHHFVMLAEEIFDIQNDEQRMKYKFPALYDWWLFDSDCYPGETFYSVWRNPNKYVKLQGNDSNISIKNLATIAMALLTLPASEAINERCFSQVKHLVTKYNRSIGSELFADVSTIKIASLFKEKYQ